MLCVVTLSVFFPSFTSSAVVCANPSAGKNPSTAADSQIFFTVILPKLTLGYLITLAPTGYDLLHTIAADARRDAFQ
jgi:hypothetical protein